MTQSAKREAPALSLVGRMRVAARAGAILVFFLGCVLLYLLWRPFPVRNPWPPFFLGGVAKIMGVRVTVRGSPPRDHAALVSNHVSWLDIPVLAGLTGTAFVAHDGLAQIGWLEWVCKMNRTVFIARDRRSTVGDQVEQVREALAAVGVLTLFPEGTTADGVTLLPFKSSLLSALVPLPEGTRVQPVWIDYGPQARDIAWLGDEPGADNFRTVASRDEPLPVTVHFLRPLDAETVGDRKAMARAAQFAIEEAMLAAR